MLLDAHFCISVNLITSSLLQRATQKVETINEKKI